MPEFVWERNDIVTAIGDDTFFRGLLANEISLIAAESGRRFDPDPHFEEGLTKIVADYRDWLQLRNGAQAAGHEGAVAAVRKLYHLFHQHFYPTFEKENSAKDTDEFTERLLGISERGLVAHNFWWDPLESTCRHASLSIL